MYIITLLDTRLFFFIGLTWLYRNRKLSYIHWSRGDSSSRPCPETVFFSFPKRVLIPLMKIFTWSTENMAMNITRQKMTTNVTSSSAQHKTIRIETFIYWLIAQFNMILFPMLRYVFCRFSLPRNIINEWDTMRYSSTIHVNWSWLPIIFTCITLTGDAHLFCLLLLERVFVSRVHTVRMVSIIQDLIFFIPFHQLTFLSFGKACFVIIPLPFVGTNWRTAGGTGASVWSVSIPRRTRRRCRGRSRNFKMGDIHQICVRFLKKWLITINGYGVQ